MVLDMNKYIGGSTDLARKRLGSVDLHTPIHPPLPCYVHCLCDEILYEIINVKSGIELFFGCVFTRSLTSRANLSMCLFTDQHSLVKDSLSNSMHCVL